MARPLLPLIAGFFVCMTALSALAADKVSPSDTSSAELRTKVDRKREHITGADAVNKTPATGAQAVLDSPVDSSDSPAIKEDK